jgi:CRISPR-associated protein Csm4
LFGQCCWAILHLHDKQKLTELLTGYTEHKPFMVIADALPQGFIARPSVPAEMLGFDSSNTKERKTQKDKKWFPESVLTMPLKQWASDPANAKSDEEMLASLGLTGSYIKTEPQDHNSLNRLSGTTGGEKGVFAPFQRLVHWYHPQIKLTLIVELDESRLSTEELLEVLTWVGELGYGKEASCGLGKFAVSLDNTVRPELVEGQVKANAWLTLAACAPQNLKIWDSQHCYYEAFTRFGRHGDMAVHQGSPFKNPILMAAPFAVLKPSEMTKQCFTGQGLGGKDVDGFGVISKTITETVHQGYAPVLPVLLGVENE